ncbi:MAG: hypothetical protein ALAOOOJD_02411 [bacterium]|nr:hypothetical protein [bacterium]
MHKLMAWWAKHSFIIMAITGGFYGLGQSGFIFDARHFPLKILLMLLVIEATPLGALAGWAVVKVTHFSFLLFNKLSQSYHREL